MTEFRDERRAREQWEFIERLSRDPQFMQEELSESERKLHHELDARTLAYDLARLDYKELLPVENEISDYDLFLTAKSILLQGEPDSNDQEEQERYNRASIFYIAARELALALEMNLAELNLRFGEREP